MAELAQVKVLRFDPDVDKEPRYETYETPYKDWVVLDVLQYIFDNLDPTLSFRYGCSGGTERCGACAVLVNGVPSFTCKKPAEEEMVIEPHPKFEVMNDLIVDFNRIKKVEKAPAVEITVDPEKCTACRDCVDFCPMLVYEIRKRNGKAVAVPVDMASCCGKTCGMCAGFCKDEAITIKYQI